MSFCNRAFFLESEGEGEDLLKTRGGRLRQIAEPTGTDGHRTIGRTWRSSPSKNSSLVEVISLSIRKTLPLPHSQVTHSPLPSTIRFWCLCLATLKLSLILGFQIPPSEWGTMLQRVEQGESLRHIAPDYGVSYEAVRRVQRAARRC